MSRVRYGAAALALSGVLLILYPAVRPWTDETTVDGAIKAMSSNAWVASHLFAMIGFVLMPLGLLALRKVVDGTRAEPVAFAALISGWIGAGLTLPFFGAEDFALNAIGKAAAQDPQLDILGLAEATRYGAVPVATFALGLLLLALSGILAAIAVWKSGVLPRTTGLPFAAGFALFLPQFYTPPAARIAHGVLLGLGSLWLAYTLWKTPRPR